MIIIKFITMSSQKDWDLFVFFSVAIIVWLEWSIDRDSLVLCLFGGECGQLHPQVVEMCSCYLLIQLHRDKRT